MVEVPRISGVFGTTTSSPVTFSPYPPWMDLMDKHGKPGKRQGWCLMIHLSLSFGVKAKVVEDGREEPTLNGTSHSGGLRHQKRKG